MSNYITKDDIREHTDTLEAMAEAYRQDRDHMERVIAYMNEEQLESARGTHYQEIADMYGRIVDTMEELIRFLGWLRE